MCGLRARGPGLCDSMASYYSEGSHETDPVAAFAQQLGIQPNEVESFMWLAEVGFQSPLPPRWAAHADASTGYIYYVNRDDHGTSWQNPLVPYLQQVINIGRLYQVEGYPGFFQEQIGILWAQLKEDLDHWHGPFNTPEGRPYYVNSVTNLSSWEDPRIDCQYIFELQNSLLNSLEQLLPPPAKVPRFGCDSPTAVRSGGSIPRPQIDQGAEIFTLDDGNAGDERPDTGMYTTSRSFTPPRSATKRLSASQSLLDAVSPKQHLAELKTAMSDIGTRQKMIEDSIQDQEEVQRLRLRQRVEQRRQRKRSQTPTPSRTSAPFNSPQSPSKGKQFQPPLLFSDENAADPLTGKRPDGRITQLRIPPSDPNVPGPPPLPGADGAGDHFAPIPSPKGARPSPQMESFSSVPLGTNRGVAALPGATADEARMLGMQEQKPVEVTPRTRGAAADEKDTLLKRPQVAKMNKTEIGGKSIERVDSNPSIASADDPLGATLC